ncbi:MAG: CbiX/SirB N-terminal domain-containing protein [Betaproteobacteria bacterium]|nr:CbiX/SirB N-terminal domain-containing protein [Betaproteobacteria bacterium]
MKGIILFGHGARNPDWAAPFHRIRDAILARQPDARVEMGFLELMRPTLDESIDKLVALGVSELVIVPIFMASGSHVKKDLPLLAASAMDRHPALEIALAEPVGEASELIGAMADYALKQQT